MDKSIKKLKNEWKNRNKLFGTTKRSVLFKRFPNWLNNHIHRMHMKFIIKNLPNNFKNLLDVGCGYGRISQEIKNLYPNMNFNGIELCSEFSRHYETKIGNCFNGPIQNFIPQKKYDVIIIVTLLMYINNNDMNKAISKLYSCLSPKGVIICIEPAIEFNNILKKFTGENYASPTGGDVKYFTLNELKGLFHTKIIDTFSLKLIPFFQNSSLHHGVVIKR